jgi:hypothetical protein
LAVLCTPWTAKTPPKVELWDIATARQLATVDGTNNGFFLPGRGYTLVTRGLDPQKVGFLAYWDGSDGRPLRRVALTDTSGYRAWYGLRVSADRRWVVVRAQEDVARDALRLRLASVWPLGWLAPADPGGAGRVLVYDAAGGGLRAEVTSGVFDDALTAPAGGHLATVAAGEIEVWEFTPGRPWGEILAWPVLPALAVGLAGHWVSRRRGRAAAAPAA